MWLLVEHPLLPRFALFRPVVGFEAGPEERHADALVLRGLADAYGPEVLVGLLHVGAQCVGGLVELYSVERGRCEGRARFRVLAELIGPRVDAAERE